MSRVIEIHAKQQLASLDANSLAAADEAVISHLAQIVEDALPSMHSKRAYRRALADFLSWYRATGQTLLDKATVQHYAAELRAGGASAANINQRLSAIRKLAAEASKSGAMPAHLAAGIRRVRGLRKKGKRRGDWLTLQEAQALMNAPDPQRLKGKRDRALLGVLLSTGIRRSEAAGLVLEQIQQREGRWVIVDLVGKRNETRTVPMPSWCKAAIDEWLQAARIRGGRVFRPVNKGDRLAGEAMSAQSVYMVIKGYAKSLGLSIGARDIRRTFAKLAHKGGAAPEQIQLTLGHQSLDTTERYLGLEQDLRDVPRDRLGLRLE